MFKEELSDQLYQKFALLLFERSGIHLKEHKKYLVYHRLYRFIGEEKNFRNFQELYEYLKENPNSQAMKDFVDRLTTNYSYFFRDPLHFQFLTHYLREKSRSQEYLRFWSAAASTGEEAYSMAMTLLENSDICSKKDVKILGTDISNDVLAKALQGIYPRDKAKEYIPQPLMHKYLHPVSGGSFYSMNESLKKLILFRHLNLLGSYPFQKQFDIVFLRNVLIYFNNQEKEKVINKIFHYLKPQGYLIIGLSETLVGINHPLKNLKFSIYKKD